MENCGHGVVTNTDTWRWRYVDRSGTVQVGNGFTFAAAHRQTPLIITVRKVSRPVPTMQQFSKFVIYHDKFLEYGGAEAVLEAFVKHLKPVKIVTSCVANKTFWDAMYGIPIEAPRLLSFIKTQWMYRLLYPLVCLVAHFYRPSNLENANVLVYSSSAAKFFPIARAKKTVFYSNFPAKPLLKLADYFELHHLNWIKTPVFRLLHPGLYAWRSIERAALSKYNVITVISASAQAAYEGLFGAGSLPPIRVLHCPVKDSIFNFADESLRPPNLGVPVAEDGPVISGVIISRLYPEKHLEDVIAYVGALPSVALTVLGGGPLLNSFTEKYSTVHFTGFVDEIEKCRYLASADFLLVPTKQEWSLVAVEANILGIPVVCVESDAIREINIAVSGNPHFPNLTYRDVSTISSMLQELPRRRKAVLELRGKYFEEFSAHNVAKRLFPDVALVPHKPDDTEFVRPPNR